MGVEAEASSAINIGRAEAVIEYEELCLKSRNHAWTQSVQGAVATWSVISMRNLPTILDSYR